jgi:transcriptional regulator with XRE-family HTH domain
VARFDADPELNRLGEALAALRREAGLSQAEAGSRVAMTSQGWGLYESGRRPGLFRPDVQRRLTAALGATTEDLSRRALGPVRAEERDSDGVRSGGRSFQPGPTAAAAPADRERIPLTNDDLAPWAASGVILEVEPERWPRKDQGCVIDLADGRRLIRLYDGADAESLFVRGGPAGLQARGVVPRADISRVAAVLSRIDG